MKDHADASAQPPPTQELDSEDQTSSNSESPAASIYDCVVKEVGRPSVLTLPQPDRALLAKLEEENRRIEADAKSHAALRHGHSRNTSDTSQISITSGTSSIHDERSLASNTATSGGATPAVGLSSEEDLWSLWGRLVRPGNWETEWKKRNQFVRDLVRQGVPHHFRGIVWQLLAEADKCVEKDHYSSYLEAKSACEKIILRDVVRTYPEVDFFKEKDGLGQKSLFNVTKAYSLHDREVGYCQGSAFIIGLLLMQMPEEEAFAVTLKIMQQHRMRDIFKPGMAELGLCIYQLENLMLEMLPELYAHFQAQSMKTTIYASSWFLTLFCNTFPIPLACRIMDVFLSEGFEIIFKVALAMMMIGQNELLSMDMEHMVVYIKRDLPNKIDIDELMNTAYSVKVNTKKMKKLEKEYVNIKTKEHSDVAMVRALDDESELTMGSTNIRLFGTGTEKTFLQCLKQENHLLKQRVELLEKESSSLAERLVRGQVDRAEGEETTFVLSREVQALRRANVDAQQRLAVAQDEIRSLEMSLADANSQQSSLEGLRSEGERLSAGGKCEELARCLQRELIRARLEAAEKEASERELRAHIAELENDNKSLRRQRVDNSVAHLQDELIAVKLREAEANLSLKDLRQKVTELSDAWTRHLQEHRAEVGPSQAPSNVVSDIMATPKKLLRAWEGRSSEVQKLEEDLMSTKMREAEALSELKELRLKVMELETQVQVSTNQLRRQDEDLKALREQLEAALQRERALQAKNREAQHKLADFQSKIQYDTMAANIKNMEHAQRIAELETEVSEYKLKHEVMATEGELRTHVDESDRVRELQERVADLKAEVVRLEAFKARALGRTEEASRLLCVEDELREADAQSARRDSILSLLSTPSTSPPS